MKIILLRHGQTQWNAMQKYQGHTDIGLNDFGRFQAKRVAQYLCSNERIEAIYCSDLSRARETAEIVAEELNLQVNSDNRLREICFGCWEGLTFSEVYDRYPREFDNWFNNTRQFQVPGGESFDQVLERSMPMLNEIAAQHNGTVLMISHGGLIKAVLNHLQGSNGLWETSLEPGSMTFLECQEGKIIPISIAMNLDFNSDNTY